MSSTQENDMPGYGIEIGIFDEEEIHTNCTVQILRNSVTGEISIGWWENQEGEDDGCVHQKGSRS